MDMSNTMKQQISQAVDADLSDAQLQALLKQLRTDDRASLVQAWDEYHFIGDVLRSDDLDVSMSTDFTKKVMASLDAEPAILVPKTPIAPAEIASSSAPNAVAANSSRYMAMTSMAAAVMVAFIMAPQIISSFQNRSAAPVMAAKSDAADSFNSNVRLASNYNKDTNGVDESVARTDSSGATNSKSQSPKEAEFAQKLENQVEMLRDPRLDSYLQAHQKVSPTFESGARHIQRANVVPEQSEK